MKTSIIRLGTEYQKVADETTLLVQSLSREGIEFVFWPGEDDSEGQIGDYPDAGAHRVGHLEYVPGVGRGAVWARVPRMPWAQTAKGYIAVTAPA